jgi:hypothetical protein
MRRTASSVELRRNFKIEKCVSLWRELARPVTFFDLCSPANFLVGEIGEIFRKKRARQDSNLL